MFKDKLSLVPNLPGCYLMKNQNGVVIYIGKAKNLHRRVSSYFNRTHTGKTKTLVSQITDFEYIVCESEVEALIMELNLIKQYDPKYNILLRDDKSYPYIEYIKKPYPMLKVSRYLNIKKKDQKILFGPYPNAFAARKIVNLLNRLYPLKKCNGKPKKVCLYYHIGECLGYCEKNVDQEKLIKMETEILAFLNGNDKILIDKINERIELYSENLQYEMAMELKRELDYIKIVMNDQKVELHDHIDRDVVGYYFDKGHISVQILFIRNGKIVGSKNKIFAVIANHLEEIETYLVHFYAKYEIPKEVLIVDDLNVLLLSLAIPTKFLFPQKGIKKKLLKMANENAKINLNNKLELVLKEIDKTEDANDSLKELLELEVLDRIDLFDNSNLFGDYAVSGMVVFKNGFPAKKEYRKYKVSIDKNDDYNTMKEVIYRRYYRVLVDKTEMPDLIIVDGGVLQIQACKEVLDSLNLNIKVCGLRKNDKHRTNDLIDGDTLESIEVLKDSNVFHYLTRMQDEVHRYTITYHRTIRSKGSISSVLDEVAGIGNVRKKQLIKEYGSVKKMKDASIEELSKVIPKETALELKKYLNSKFEKEE